MFGLLAASFHVQVQLDHPYAPPLAKAWPTPRVGSSNITATTGLAIQARHRPILDASKVLHFLDRLYPIGDKETLVEWQPRQVSHLVLAHRTVVPLFEAP